MEVSPADAKPIHSAPSRASERADESEKNKIAKLLPEESTKPKLTDWATPVAYLPKKDGSLRPQGKIWRRNAFTSQYMYPVQRMNDCFNSRSEAALRSLLDANSMHLELEIKKEDQDKTGFSS